MSVFGECPAGVFQDEVLFAAKGMLADGMEIGDVLQALLAVVAYLIRYYIGDGQ